ncbi:uncharacterized protein pclob isoform 7-T7 [Menidia menidia]
MFSSKFLSGANPLNAVSSAVNKFGLFGDDGEGDKKSPPQQGRKPSGEQQPGAGPGKNSQQQQTPTGQKPQPVQKQGSPKLQSNEQTGPTNKPAGQQATSNTGAESLKKQPKGPSQQSSPKPGVQQQVPTKSGSQPESPKASSQQQVPPKTKMQQGPAKTGAQQQQSTTPGPQGSPKIVTDSRQQQQQSPKIGQQQDSAKVGQQQKGARASPQLQPSGKQQGIGGPGTPDLMPASSPSPGANKGRSQSKTATKSLCPVCNTTELNMQKKEPPNFKTCTKCKTEVCSLCGFSPPDSDGREWLCLTCQIQRAQGTPEPVVPATKKLSPNKTAAPQSSTKPTSEPVKKDMSAPGSPQQMQSKSIKMPAKDETAMRQTDQKSASSASPQKMTPEIQRASGSQKPPQTGQMGRKQSSATPASQQESGGLFGFGAAKTEPVTGKMFGFGSSIFSSASTLIASAVQDEPKTPPVSPKAPHVQKSEQDKKLDQPQPAKSQPATQSKVEKSTTEAPKAAATTHSAPRGGQSSCPLCKMALNVGSKDPPNYNTCTECKSIVCNQCGFNPIPNVKEGKEWLCLNCQVKRAAGGIEPPRETSPANSSKKAAASQPAPQKTPAPGSPHKKLSTSAEQPAKVERPESHKPVSPAPSQKTPQQIQKTAQQKQTDQTAPNVQKQGTPAMQESGSLFGFGGPKSQIDAGKSSESVTGKMFGFGSSIFSSASTLITSAVQDESKISPTVSPKMSPARNPKSPSVKKPEQKPQQAKESPPVQPKADNRPSEPKKSSASPVVSKAGPPACPLCKVELNVGSKDPPNYNTCTTCRNNVCNQCGFNPMPNVKEVNEWLCLNCQMQRALGTSEPPGTPMMKLQTSPNKTAPSPSALKRETPLQQKGIATTVKSKEASPSGSPQRKTSNLEKQPAMTEVKKESENQKQASTVSGQKIQQQGQKTDLQTPPNQTSQAGSKKSKQDEERGLLNSGGAKPRPDVAKPAESLGGKMFGFGSSIFSSASTLITSAGQDESKKTPPLSPKMPTAVGLKTPPVQKPEQKKAEQAQQPKTSPLLQPKTDIAPAGPQKVGGAPDVSKVGQNTCPLCKLELNFGSKDPPNYNKCTDCKSTVCNQCGFNPMPNVSEVKEWLCLNCQMHRALSASEPTGPVTKPQSGPPSSVQQKITGPSQKESLKKESEKSDSKTETPVPVSVQKQAGSTQSSPLKTQHAAVPPTTKAAEGSPTPGQKTPLGLKGVSDTQKLADQGSQPGVKHKVTPHPQEPVKPPALSGFKTGPESSKTTESLGGKMFGFGSSIFSSASNLISTAVQEESRTTPPGSRKMSAPAQVSRKMSAVPKVSPKGTPTLSPKLSPAREPKTLPQKPEEEKKLNESQQEKGGKVPPQQRADPDAGQTACPLCKVQMNVGSKQPPNYTTCTECKTTVCNQCGFNPMPGGEVKEWLCLTCQMKRAVGAAEPPGSPAVKPQTSPSKIPSPVPVQLADHSKPAPLKKKDLQDSVEQKQEPAVSVSSQRKQSTPSNKPEAGAPVKQASPKPDQKKLQQKEGPVPEKVQDQATQPGRKQSNATSETKQGLGGFLSFGDAKGDATKATESVSGKMLGFGSSIFSSASTLITSAVQDQPKTTPPVSPKMSPAKESKSPTTQKVEQGKKPEQLQQIKDKSSVQPKSDDTTLPASQAKEQLKKEEVKVDKVPSEAPKPDASVKPGQSACPLCKVKLNMGSKDPPNYNSCTECKNTVCMQCGFNPMPNETAVKEWLCLTCQMQRALGEAQPPGVTSLKSQTPPKPQQKDNTGSAGPEKKETSAPQSPQRKLSTTAQPVVSANANKLVQQKPAGPVPSPKKTQENQKPPGPDKSPMQTKPSERKQSNANAVPQKESGSFFGFGGGKTQPEADKQAESVSGKMFGFGSSIFSSASTLINSAVQDQPKTTPPVSPKMSPAKEINSAASQVKKPEQLLQNKTLPVVQTKSDKAPVGPPKAEGASSQAAVKPQQSTCPLCKAEINVQSKDPPNYNTCTECKNTVCNQCGFNPVPNEAEMKEWLCLTCQMQRALKATESPQPPSMKPREVSTPGGAAANQNKESISKQEAGVKDKIQDSLPEDVPQKKQDDSKTQTAASPAVKDISDVVSDSAKGEERSLPPVKDIPPASVPQNKETGLVSDLKTSKLDSVVAADVETLDKETTPISTDSSKVKSEESQEKIHKLTDQLITASEEVQHQQALNKESHPVEKTPAESGPPPPQPASFGGIGSPKSNRTTAAVTGKVLGFGSSLFSSASTLITSAVQDESQTTPRARKMSAPQVSDKTSERQIPLNPQLSPRRSSLMEGKLNQIQKTHLEKKPVRPLEAKAPTPEQSQVQKDPAELAKTEVSQMTPEVAQSTCPLCKVDLNMDSKNIPNYNTCTDCKTTVCNKCGFNPMPNAPEVKEWLCLNCQMQRALGVSEPPGLPMIKPQPSPIKEIPATIQKKETPTPDFQADIPKQDKASNDVANISITENTTPTNVSAPSKELTATPKTSTLPEKSVSPTVTKAEVLPPTQKPPSEIPKAQSAAPQKQAQKVDTSSKPAPAPDPEKRKASLQQSPKDIDSPAKPAPPPVTEARNLPSQQPPKTGTSPAKSPQPPVQPAKQESGSFFGFGGPKTQPTPAKSAESVTGKMFGFGSSFLSSASTLITSAVQDEPKTTPPTPRKLSTADKVTPTTTPPASPKTGPTKDSKSPPVQKTEKKTEKPQQDKIPSTEQAKVDKTPPVPPKEPGGPHHALKADQSVCPLCKIQLTTGTTDPPNYNTCTECKATVCNQCGFNPMPNMSEVQEWLCLNCQMHRALQMSESSGPAVVKPQPSPAKVSQPASEQKPVQNKDKQKEVIQATAQKKEPLEAETPTSAGAQGMATPKQQPSQKGQVVSTTEHDAAGQPPPAQKQPQVQASQNTKLGEKSAPPKQEPSKLPQQPSKAATQPVKAVPPAAKTPKQESGSFFGFGAPKVQPTAVKSGDSVTGKMFGFGSSFLSSASTMITSAVQDEAKITPPSQRKMSTTSPVSPRATPPVSPKATPAKDTKPPVPQKSEPPPQAKAEPSKQEKEEKALDVSKSTKEVKVAPEVGQSTCPLCKVELNVDSKDPPNYNNCTECKSTVCNLCGFNPAPHTGAKEWLCLNCQTQRALSAQLGDSGKKPQPTPVTTKSEIQSTPVINMADTKHAPAKPEAALVATKQESVPTHTETGPVIQTTKEKEQAVKMETMATIPSKPSELETTPVSSTSKVSTVAEEAQPLAASIAEPSLDVTMQMQQATEVASKAEVPSTQLPEASITENKQASVKYSEVSETEGETEILTAPSLSVIEVKDAPIPLIPAEISVSKVVIDTDIKLELSEPKSIILEEQPEDHVKPTEPTKSLSQDEQQSKSQEQQPTVKAEPDVGVDTKEKTDRITENLTENAPSPDTQQLSTESIHIENLDENIEEHVESSKTCLPAEHVQMELSSETNKPKSKTEEHADDEPQVIPVLQEVIEEQMGDVNKTDINIEPSMPVNEDNKTERRRLSFQAMDESSESELTPTPSPKIQRKNLKVDIVTSSSEDIKTESADSSVEDDEFIRKQIMGMGDEEEMCVSEDEKEKNLENEEVVKEVKLDNDNVTIKPLTGNSQTDNEDNQVKNEPVQNTDSATSQSVPETVPVTTFKKAIPVARQRQSTDEEVESITESLSKGSSSVQASSITPGNSPTSASSLEEDSDSSPHRKKIGGDKRHRKGKHRQPTQPLPTIEDSSEEDKGRAHGQPLSPLGDASSTEDLRGVTVTDESHRTSGSEYSASVESESDNRRAVQRGRKPSPTVIPYTPSDPFIEKDNLTKSLKSAEEAYEEIIHKTQSIPGESPPDVEPLYGGMAIEDYLYESLVEEPKLSESVEPKNDTDTQPVKKLRSPEEVYEEMMQKKRELIMIEQEFQQAQTAMESSSESLVHDVPLVSESYVVIIPCEDTNINEESSVSPPCMDTLSEFPAKKKKRPAPPRPSEPPKRPEVTVVPSTTSVSISFIRPMVPQDPALRKALFPIPDLKITQCSSGEEDDDSLADEYAIGISSDITPSDDSETKDDLSSSPALSETTEMEPICVVCEIPEPKPIPSPISAPELTTTPSPVSPVSSPTSPATPDSSLASNATSSSTFQAQTPLSSDSTPLSTPTPPSSFKDQSIPGTSMPTHAVTVTAVTENVISYPTPTTAIVTIPDVVTDPSKAEKTGVFQVKTSTTEGPTPPQVDTSIGEPVVVQMPDLVSSPSQVTNNVPTVSQVLAPSAVPAVVSVHTSQARVSSVVTSTPTFALVSSVSCSGPVVVQMPDLVSTTAPITADIPQPISALITASAQAEAKVVHSVPIQSPISSVSPVVVPTQAYSEQGPPPTPASTTVVKKKVPPPPPPRSTSVSLPEATIGIPAVKCANVTPMTSAIGTTVATQPMQSIVVDIQPRMEDIQPDHALVPQIVTPTRQGHVVIIVPSVENVSQVGKTTQVVANTGETTVSLQYSSETDTHSVSDINRRDILPLSPNTSAVQEVSAPPLPPTPPMGIKVMHSNVEVPVPDSRPSLPSTLPKPGVYPKPPITTPGTTTTAAGSGVSVTSGPSQTSKPPPIPPKPISIPAGLVFSHKAGESVKPPPPSVAPKAATLPRTKEPPNALSLSLTRPVESKLGAASPKSPVSPRHTKCLQTYVVITLPSEPGSPTETITVQAPVRRGSIPSSNISGIRTTPLEQKTPMEVFSAPATVRRASVPAVKHPPPILMALDVATEQVTSSEELDTTQARIDSVPSAVQPPLSAADIITVPSDQDTSIKVQTVLLPIKKPFVQQQQQVIQSLPPAEIKSDIATIADKPNIHNKPQTVQAQEQSMPNVPQQPSINTEFRTLLSAGMTEKTVPQTIETVLPYFPTEVFAKSMQPDVPLDAVVIEDTPSNVIPAVAEPQISSKTDKLQQIQNEPTQVIVIGAVQVTSAAPLKHQEIAAPEPFTVFEAGIQTKVQELSSCFNTSPNSGFSLPQTVFSENLPTVTQQLPPRQLNLVSDVMTLPMKEEFPTDAITIDSSMKTPVVADSPSVLDHHTVVTEVTPRTVIPEVMPQSTVTVRTVEETPTLLMEVEHITHQDVPPIAYIPQKYGAITNSIMSQPATPLEVRALQFGHETPASDITKETDSKHASIPSSEIQPQVIAGIPVITTEEMTCKRRMSISSQPPYPTNYILTYPTDYEMPTQGVTTEAFSSRKQSIAMQQPSPCPQSVNIPAEKDIPVDSCSTQVPCMTDHIPSTEHMPQKITYSSEYDYPLEIITTEAYTRRTSIPTAQDIPQGVTLTPVTITKFQQKSIESQEIRGPEKVVSSMSHMYSSSISTSGQPPEILPSLVTQVVTTEVQRTTVSVVHERLPQVPPSSVEVTIQPDLTKVQHVPKQNGKIIYPGDVIDLRTVKPGIKMTDQGMDLTPPESCRQSFSSDFSGRQITAVQPEIVNLSSEITPATTLSVVTDSITIVTCTATIASYNNTPAEKPLDLQGPVTSLPLPLTTYKPFEPLTQIVYRPVKAQPILSASADQDIPINLSFEALFSSGGKPSISSAPTINDNGNPVVSLETTGAIDLSNYRQVKAMVTLSGTKPGVVTTIVEDHGIPVDLTAGRRSVCCDVIYKLPFTGSCRAQPAVTTQPENRFGYRDDHYQYDNVGLCGMKGINGIKSSVSETNLTEAGLSSYDLKNDYDYFSGSPDSAIDLTAAKLSAGEALDYTSKAARVYPEMIPTPHSQVPAGGYGVNSTLRTSEGVVYSSVAAPVPSTYAITTQPGSIFSTNLPPNSAVQDQSLPYPYGFIPDTDTGQIIPFETGLPKELLPTALADIITGYPDMYSDTTLEAIAASLDALASSPIFPGLDNTKMAQYQMEREFLELEKLKQLCLAEELEWERQEIQRYREQEQIMVQRELEELQALKQQLLLQQEEEYHAHMVAQQETYAQQKEQLQQIQQLQLQLQHQLDEHYGTTGTTGNLLEAKYAGVGDSGQYWPVKDESTYPTTAIHVEESHDQLNIVKLQADQDIGKKILDSGVQTDDEDSAEKQYMGRKKKNKRNIDSSAQTDDEDQDEWDAPTKARRRSRKHSSDGKHGSKVSSIAIQTVAEISVQTDHSGTIKRPSVQMDTKVEIIKHISAPENSQRSGSLSCQTDLDRRHISTDVGYSTHLTADTPSKSKVFYTQVSTLSPEKSYGGQRMLTADPTRFSSGPRILKAGQKSLSDPKSLSPSTEDSMAGYYADSYSGRGSASGTGKKVKRTLPDPPPEDDTLAGRSGYSTNSARRRLARSTTMARAKILQDIDKELDLVERESSKLRKKQAELDEEEKEIDAKLRYLEMGINRRKEALLKEREKRERAYLQGVAEERDYMSDSEVSNIREARGDGLERPRTAPQSEFDQFIPPQTEADSQYNTLTSPYSHYAQYVPQTQTTSHYSQQSLYQQQSLYHQQVSPYPTLSISHAQAQPSSYQHALLLQQGKQRQTNVSDLEPKITTDYDVIRNQPLLIVPTSTESGYGVAHLGGKYSNLDLRVGLEERSMASSPMSSISADSFYADIDHHNARNYVLIEDIGELTKASTGLSNTGLGSGFSLPDKELSKADRLLRAADVRRTAEVAEFLGSSRYGKGEDDTMEEPYELKLLKQQIKQEFRRGNEGLEHLSALGLPQYFPSDGSFRHFPKGEKYSIGRLTLEKQAAKQLPAAMLYQKQMKNKKALIDPKAITKFSPIQESRDIEPEYGSYMGSGASSVSNLAARARLLQDEITFGLRKNLSEQQKYLGSSLGASLSGSLNLGHSIGMGSTIRTTGQDDGTYPSGTRSRPSSRPSSRPTSVYGLDLSIKRDLSSSSLRLKTEGEVLDAAFAPGVPRTKPTSLPISQSRGRIPIVAQNSEEESPLSPVGQPMGMARASAGPLPPISADSRDQFGSSHSLPEVQQHMREESRTQGYDRDIAFIMDDLQGAMSDSEALSESMLAFNRDDAIIFHESIRHAGGPNWNIEAYHLRREDTDWFDKPRDGHPQSGHMSNRRQMKLAPYAFPNTRIKLKKDMKDPSISGNGLGIRVVGGKEIPGTRGEIGAYIAKVNPGGVAEQTGKVMEGMQVLEWNGIPLTGKTYEEVQCIMGQPCAEAELCVRLDLNMLSDPERPQALEQHVQLKAVGGQRSPGVDPKQLAAELQKVSQQQGPGMTGTGQGSLGVLSALERSALLHSGPGSAASSGVPSPGQPASPAINKKQRQKQTEITKAPHPITGEIQLQINYDRNLGNLIVHVLQARNLVPRDNDGYSDPFVKVYLLPGRGQVMVVQNASADNKRRTKYAQKTTNPEWNQTVIYKNIHLEQLKKKTLEVTVWDYDRSSSNDFLGEVLIDLSNTAQLDNTPRWLPLKEQSESIEHTRAHHAAQAPPGSGSGQGYGQGDIQSQGQLSGSSLGHGMGQALGPRDGGQDSPKNSVIKSRSHGIFPDPAKDMQMLPLEKSHSSPGSSKSSSDGQLRSHGPSRSQSKSSVTQAHLEDAGIAIAAAEAAVQQSRLQPRPGHRLGDVSGSVVLSAPSLVGDTYGDLDGEEGVGTGVDSAIFQVPRIGKTIPNGTDKNQQITPENEGGKTQIMGEIKVALKKEVKTEGDQLVLEILQCRNITYKFKSPDHLPDLYVKLYVVNVATQKRIIKKKTRVCRHDREPSFNETFRFQLNPTGHSIQLFLVSNGGKFVKKTLIGEAYIWLDKVDMRKRVVSWHKLFVSSTQTNP